MAETTGSATGRSRMVTGLFRDRESAERAYGSVTTRGYSNDDVNLLMSDETRDKHFTTTAGKETELGNKALEGAGTGAAIGGTVGATLAAIAAIGTTLALPGLGLLVAGPIAAGLSRGGAGGGAGGASRGPWWGRPSGEGARRGAKRQKKGGGGVWGEGPQR